MKSISANPTVWIFACFSAQLLYLQISEHGRRAYFSEYVAKEWNYSGYLLYGALIYFFVIYAINLIRNQQFIAGLFQAFSLILLLGIMLLPYSSLDHISFLPYIVTIQICIFFSDYNSRVNPSMELAPENAWGYVYLILLSPIILIICAYPPMEKLFIYVAAAILCIFSQPHSKTIRWRQP